MTRKNPKAKKCGCNPKLGYVVCTKNGAKGKGGRGFRHLKNKKCR